jgi:hypothetical protein
MIRQFAFHAAASHGVEGERRLRGRVRQQGVICNYGAVIDLSAGGIRVLSTRPLEGTLPLQINGRTHSVTLMAEVVWCRRAGFRRFMSGMRFLNPDEATLRVVSQIAAAHRAEFSI